MFRDAENFLFNRRRSLRRQIFLIAMLPLVVSLGVAFLVHQTMRDVAEAEGKVEHAVQSLVIGQELLVSLIEIQAGLRGFVISGEEALLEPYHRSLAEFESSLSALRSHWADRPDRVGVLGELEGKLVRYRGEVAEPLIALTRQSLDPSLTNTEAAAVDEEIQQFVESGLDSQMIDGMKAGVRGFLLSDRRTLASQIAVVEQRRSLARTAGLAGPPLAVVIALLLISILLQRIARSLEQVAAGVKQVERGDYEFEVEVSGNRELAAVTRGFNAMVDTLKSRERQALVINRLNRSLASCRDTAEAWQVAARYLPRILGGFKGAVHAYRTRRDSVEPVCFWGEGVPESMTRPFRPDDCWALRSGYDHHVEIGSGDPICSHLVDADNVDTFCVPMSSGEEIIGVLSVFAGAGLPLDAAQRETVHMLAETLALSIANLRLREALRSQAIRDPLTGLYNRRFLDETLSRELSRSERTGHPLSLIVLDADHFKRINDTWGHDAGDAVLLALSRLLSEQARDMDIVCRVGGEEFLVVMPRTDTSSAVSVAERLRETAECLNIHHQGKSLERVTLSLGVASYPTAAADAPGLLKAADQALYRAKQSGRNRVETA